MAKNVRTSFMISKETFSLYSDLEACNMTKDIIYENSEKIWNFQHRIQRHRDAGYDAADYLGAVSYKL
jgi:hypothetical protein